MNETCLECGKPLLRYASKKRKRHPECQKRFELRRDRERYAEKRKGEKCAI